MMKFLRKLICRHRVGWKVLREFDVYDHGTLRPQYRCACNYCGTERTFDKVPTK